MSFLLFWSLFFVLSTTVCQFGFVYGGIDRTFRGLNKGSAEAAVDPLHESSTGGPSFDTEVFVHNAEAYLAFNLTPYVTKSDYEVSFGFYDEETGNRFETKPAYCTGLRVTIVAKVLSFSTYRNQVSFWIREGLNYE